MNLRPYELEQKKLSEKINLLDSSDKVSYIAGIDHAFTEDKVVTAIVVVDAKSMVILEKKHIITDINFPYIPEFISHREGPPSISAYRQLKIDPDLIIVDGNGIIHPRKMGVASYIGLMLNKPTIGIAKYLLCGDVSEDTVYIDKEAVGKYIATKDMANPILVNPGHKISLSKSVEIVKSMINGHKLPFPLHEAKKLAGKIKRKELGGKE